MNKNNHLCQYDDPDGIKCTEDASSSGYCYWHDKSIDKSGPHVKEALIEYTRSGGMTRGICLMNADLSNIDLINHEYKTGFDFSYADFYRANLSGAHLFNIKLAKASLMKADLRYANLNCANVKLANLLGIKWKACKIENIRLSKHVRQEVDARDAQRRGENEKAKDYYEQAEEIYRALRKHSEMEGIFTLSGDLIQRELTMRRKQMPLYSFKRFSSKIVDLFCGYGEDPIRIVGISILFIIFCALIYTFTGLNYNNEFYAFDSSKSFLENFHFF